MGPVVLNPILTYARLALAHPPYQNKLETQFLIALHHSFVYSNLSIKQTWRWLCVYSYKLILGLIPWLHLLYFTNDSNAMLQLSIIGGSK